MNQEVLFDFPDEPKKLFAELQKASAEIGIKRIALVGGAVRDLLLHQNQIDTCKSLKDLDFVVEGSAKALSKALCNNLGGSYLKRTYINDSYDTVKLVFNGVLIDLASARKESYPKPAMNPEVTIGTIEEDLRRRDFTVNAIIRFPRRAKKAFC